MAENKIFNVADESNINDLIVPVIAFFESSSVSPSSLIDTGLKLITNWKQTNLFNKFNYFYQITKDQINEEHSQKFIQKLDTNTNFKQNGLKIIVELVDKVLTDSNIDILKNLFVNAARSKLSDEQFIRLSLVLQRVSFNDLVTLTKYNPNNDFNFTGYYDHSATDILLSAGLLTPLVIGVSQSYQLNNLGHDMVKYGLKLE